MEGLIIIVLIICVTFIIIHNINSRCKHEWIEVEQIKIMNYKRSEQEGVVYVSKCSKCGNYKKYIIRS